MNTLSQDNIARFDALAKEWDDDPRRVGTAKAIATAIMTTSRPRTDERAFEFGCGTGLLSLALAGDLGRIVAMDSSAEKQGSDGRVRRYQIFLVTATRVERTPVRVLSTDAFHAG